MCGIAGMASAAPTADSRLVEAMSRAVAHRGPDGSGLVVRPHAVLAHRRLAIIDVAGGKQPLSNEDGTIWITYNGEVYNHAALRADLEARGHVFRTASDTEAIVHAYEEDGPECVRRLRGMFAFGLWDGRRRRLVLARDRFGIKPVYYARVGRDLIFASELRALLASPDVDRTLDEDALACYLALRYVPAPMTLVRGVRKLPPASLLVWHDGELRIERYWDLLDERPGPHAASQHSRASINSGASGPSGPSELARLTPGPTEAEAAAQLRELIDEAVSLRLMSEVPLGAFLSGGLDSTVVTSAMLAAARRDPTRLELPLRSFAVGYDDEGPAASSSELGWAALASHELGTAHHEVHVRAADVRAHLPRIVGDLDEPVADPAAVPLWFLARHTREHVTVVLSGEGGDELFAGYAAYRTMQRLDRLHALVGGDLLRAFARVAPIGPASKIGRALSLASRPLEARYRGVSRGLAVEGRAGEALLGLTEARRIDAAVRTTLEPLWERTRGLSPLRRMLYLDANVWLPDELLVKADKITMASAIELRVPLLDHRLAEFAWALPEAWLLDGGEGKRLLRSAARGRVPEAILRRPKMGFATPTGEWLRGPLEPLVRSALLGADSLVRSRLRPVAIESLVDRHRRGAADHTAELWTLLVLELWRNEVKSVARLKLPAVAEVS